MSTQHYSGGIRLITGGSGGASLLEVPVTRAEHAAALKDLEAHNRDLSGRALLPDAITISD